MAHFAELDENNVVLNVLVVDNDLITDANGDEQELLGVKFLNTHIRKSNWKQTSYNGNFRYHYAEIDGTYNEEYDAFIPPPLFPSWTTLNTETMQYEPAVGIPVREKNYRNIWDEANQQWNKIPIPPGDPGYVE